MKKRITEYFDPDMNHEEIARRYPDAMRTTPKFNARTVRETLLVRGALDAESFVRYAYRPFDNCWLCWESESGLLDTPCMDYKPHVFDRNVWLEARKREPREAFSCGTSIRHIGVTSAMGCHIFSRYGSATTAWEMTTTLRDARISPTPHACIEASQR